MGYATRSGHHSAWLCEACKGEFNLATKRLSSRSAPKCPLCGSYSIVQKTTHSTEKRLDREWISRVVRESRREKRTTP